MTGAVIVVIWVSLPVQEEDTDINNILSHLLLLFVIYILTNI